MKLFKTFLSLLVCFSVLLLAACDGDIPFVDVDSSVSSGLLTETSDTADNSDPDDNTSYDETDLSSDIEFPDDTTDTTSTDATASTTTNNTASSGTGHSGKTSSSNTSSKKSGNTSSKKNTDTTPSTVEQVFDDPSASTSTTSKVTTTSVASTTTTASNKPVTYGNYKAISDSNRFCYKYGNLTTKQKTLYSDIKTAIKNKTTKITFSSKPKPDDVVLVLQCVTDDYPEYYWVDASYTFTTNNSGECEDLTLKYINSGDASKLTAAVTKFKNSVPDGLSEYDRELMAHDYICNLAEYDVSSVGNTNSGNTFARTAYGALVTKSCVCEGYSRAMELLLNSVGIECSLVRGSTYDDAGVESHMWNQVLIGGSWYNTDVTWDDPYAGMENAPVKFFHAFFNMNDEETKNARHEKCPLYSSLSSVVSNDNTTVAMFNIAIKSCKATAMNYYVKNSEVLSSSSTDISIISAAVRKADAAGLNYCELHATGSSSYTGGKGDMATQIWTALDKRIRSCVIVTPSNVSGKYFVYWKFR